MLAPSKAVSSALGLPKVLSQALHGMRGSVLDCKIWPLQRGCHTILLSHMLWHWV